MGLFSKFLGLDSRSSIEKKLEKIYVSYFQGMTGASLAEAKKIFKEQFEQVKANSTKQGTINLPDNYGDILITKETLDDKIKSYLIRIRKEGVSDEDIRWWWNRHDLERGMHHSFDVVSRLSEFKKKAADGMNERQAAEWVNKHYPNYGAPTNISIHTSEDRPLPYELGNRVNIYIEKRFKLKVAFEAELNDFSSFNALVRQEIRKGNL
jgi:hypothetical protein